MIDVDTIRARLSLPLDVGGGGPAGAPPDARHAAVSVVLRPGARGAELLLIKRAAAVGDPWSGHMAFPGGKREPGDAHLLETAIRETLEETGLVLHAAPPVWMGRLGAVSPRGPKRRPSGEPLPPIVVTPFLFGVGVDSRAVPADPAEVERVHWVPLADLAHPDNEGVYRMPFGAAFRSFPSIDVEGEQVWGLTWRVVDALMGRIGVRAQREPGG